MMEKIPASGRREWLLCYLLTFLICTIGCCGFVTPVHIRSNDAMYWPLRNDLQTQLNLSPSIDDAALLAATVFQSIIDASPIGLPIAGLAAAFVLSKSGIQQRKDLRTEVEQVQTNIIKKSEEADIAGKASKVRQRR